MYESPSSNSSSFEHCLFLIPAPADGVVYRCFHRIAQTWRSRLSHERLLIEGDVPLSTSFESTEPRGTIAKLLDASIDVIARIELHFGGLQVVYVRSGGHGPQLYRQSFFDEVRLQLEGASALAREEIRQLLVTISTHLNPSAATGTAEFTDLTESLPLRMRAAHEERRT